MRYHYKKPDIYLSMYGNCIYAIIQCMTDVHYLQLVKRFGSYSAKIQSRYKDYILDRG